MSFVLAPAIQERMLHLQPGESNENARVSAFTLPRTQKFEDKKKGQQQWSLEKKSVGVGLGCGGLASHDTLKLSSFTKLSTTTTGLVATCSHAHPTYQSGGNIMLSLFLCLSSLVRFSMFRFWTTSGELGVKIIVGSCPATPVRSASKLLSKLQNYGYAVECSSLAAPCAIRGYLLTQKQ
eukprot:2471835-Amphidinium_carterae.1